MELLIFKIFGTFLGIILPIICLYWVFKPPEYFWEEHKNISSAIFFGSFISCLIIFHFGFDSYLWFIPSHWAFETDNGEIETLQSSLSFIIGIAVIGCLFICLRKLSLQNRQYRFEENMRLLKEQRKICLISTQNKEDRTKILSDCKAAQKTLEQINDSIMRRTNNMNPEEERQHNVLKTLISEYDDMIKSYE